MTDEGPGPEPQEEGDLYDELAGPEEASDFPSEGQPPVPEQPSVADSDGSGSHPRSRWARWTRVFLGLLLGALLGILLLIGWTKAVNSDSFCTRCHTMQASADTAAHSVHSDVSCIACHRGVGVRGAIAYIPTFAREVVDQLTPLSIASGTMDPAPCESCHDTIFTTPLLAGEHPSTGCNDCHGNTVHPQPQGPPEPIANPHPVDWIDVHGREANRDPNQCATCHLLSDQNGSGTCMACHFRGDYPHPKNWIPQHGKVQQEQGPDACTLCHASTFCAGCHGTEIPHDLTTWLPQHPATVYQNGTAVQCLLCHAVQDCINCHVRHGVHKQQGLYDMEKP